MTIKFLTINIWFGGIVWDNLIPFIHSVKPDVLCIQEVYDGHDQSLEKRFCTMEEFRREFSYLSHDTFGATVFDTGVNIAWGNAIFSKYPIQGGDTIFFDLPLVEYNFTTDVDPRFASEGMQEAEILVDGKSIFVYSWHGVWNDHGGDTPEREIMENAIVERIKDKERVILAGDTNMLPDSGVIKRIQERLGLESVFGESLVTTFNMERKPNPGNYAHSPVDMIFTSKNISVIRKEMMKVDVSDHYPLYAELEV